MRKGVSAEPDPDLVGASLREEDENSSDRWITVGSLGVGQEDPDFDHSERNPYRQKNVEDSPKDPGAHL